MAELGDVRNSKMVNVTKGCKRLDVVESHNRPHPQWTRQIVSEEGMSTLYISLVQK